MGAAFPAVCLRLWKSVLPALPVAGHARKTIRGVMAMPAVGAMPVAVPSAGACTLPGPLAPSEPAPELADMDTAEGCEQVVGR